MVSLADAFLDESRREDLDFDAIMGLPGLR